MRKIEVYKKRGSIKRNKTETAEKQIMRRTQNRNTKKIQEEITVENNRKVRKRCREKKKSNSNKNWTLALA